MIRTALTKTTERMLGPALAFTATGTVLDRLAALDDGPPSPSASTRVAALGPLAVLTAAVVAVFGAWGTYGHEGVLGIVGVCLA